MVVGSLSTFFTLTTTARATTPPTRRRGHWQEATDETVLVENFETGRSRSHTHSFRLGSDYRIGDRHALSFVYNGTYSTSHYNQHTTGTQTATNLSGSTSWLHNGRLDYEAPIGLKAGAEFTWYRTPGHQQLTSEMEGTRLDFYTTDMQRASTPGSSTSRRNMS